jgi:uncharacterized protein YerC
MMPYMIKPKNKQRPQNLINWNTMSHQALINALMASNSPDLMKSFLDDLLTKQEIETLSCRFQIVVSIMLGTPYKYISQTLGVSSKAIARISKLLINKRGGFQSIIKKMHPNGMHYSD